MADELDIEVCSAIGLMISLWSWSLDNTPNGALENLSYKTLARSAGYSGDADSFVECLINVGFIDKKKGGALYLHDWEEYAGDLLESRRKNAERQKKFREKSKNGNDNVTRYITEHPNVTSPLRNGIEKSREEKSREEKNNTSSTDVEDELTPSESTGVPFEKIRILWNDTAISFPKLTGINGKRKTMLSARWKEHPDLDWWADLFDRLENSSFLRGKNDRGWKAKFDWILNPANLDKVLEGNYDDPKKKGGKDDDPLRGFARTADWCEGAV